ncbi:hypothetical protein HAX54_039166 [Datura stramonium]|uniref:Uncharacterized protein n=1 Tax=Datura stramonium TaxID=4076 RepID=A0ABS8SIQ4_DATST|nr:hypothetical protein [Datura stramonium]
MAQISILKAFLVALTVVVFSAAATTSAQEIGLAPAPAPDAGAGFSLAQSETTSAQEIGLAPAPDAGAGFSLAQSGASWLLLSVVALLRH